MYPRVKVREEEPEAVQKENNTSYRVRVIESLSLEDHFSRIVVANQGIGCLSDSQPPHARILKPHFKDPSRHSILPEGKIENGFDQDNKTKINARISESDLKNSLTPSTASKDSKVGKNNTGFDEDNKSNIRASSVPPPRAVLSSPDNDGIIGSQNHQSRQKPTAVRVPISKNDVITVQEKKTQPKRQNLSSNTEAITQAQPRCASSLTAIRVSKEVTSNNSSISKKKASLSTPNKMPPFK